MNQKELNIAIKKAIIEVFTNKAFSKVFTEAIIEGFLKNKEFINELRKTVGNKAINENAQVNVHKSNKEETQTQDDELTDMINYFRNEEGRF